MKLTLPLSVTIPRKTKADKVWILNLNNYRNTHHFTLNAGKIAWKGVVFQAIPKLGTTDPALVLPDPPLRFTYTVFPSSNRKFDTSNVCSIVDKFTCDALIEYGVLSDDSYKIIPVVIYQYGHVDKENPRCELLIESICDPFTKEDEKIVVETGI